MLLILVYQDWEKVRELGQQAVLGGRCDCLTFHRVGEGRACWSLGNAYVSMGSPAQALTFAKKHLQISQEVSHAHSPRPLLEPASSPSSSSWAVPTGLSEHWAPKVTVSTSSLYKGQWVYRKARACFLLLECWCPMCGFFQP